MAPTLSIRCSLYRRSAALALLTCSALAHAGSSNGTVTDLYAHAGDVVMFAAGTHTGRPACSGNEWALSLSTQSGRAMYALLLSAQAQGKAVFVSGANNCAAWGDRETPTYIRLTP